MKFFGTISTSKKKTIMMFLGFSYVFTFTFFGLLFWRIANVTSGEFFIFREDINTNIIISEFTKTLNLGKDKKLNEIIKDLVNTKEYDRVFFKTSKDGFEHLFSNDGVIGEKWAEYYNIVYKYKGATHFKFYEESTEKILGKYNAYKTKIIFYNIATNKEISSSYIYILNYPFYKGVSDNKYYPMDIYFKNIVSNSISYIDNSPIVMKNIVQESYCYSFWNFIYFSVITITTLGYGDIIPNSSIVRILVMVESVTGVTILGLFVSCAFCDKK